MRVPQFFNTRMLSVPKYRCIHITQASNGCGQLQKLGEGTKKKKIARKSVCIHINIVFLYKFFKRFRRNFWDPLTNIWNFVRKVKMKSFVSSVTSGAAALIVMMMGLPQNVDINPYPLFNISILLCCLSIFITLLNFTWKKNANEMKKRWIPNLTSDQMPEWTTLYVSECVLYEERKKEEPKEMDRESEKKRKYLYNNPFDRNANITK